jgi:hypothetical protein
MIFTEQEFARYTPLNGMVVIEIDHLIAEKVYFKKTGVGLSVITSGDHSVADQAVRYGTVVKVPHNPVPRAMGYPFTSPIEIKEGDTVYWSRFAISRSLNDQSSGGRKDITIEVNGKLYLTILYSELLLCVRDGNMMGLNDYIIARTIPDTPETFLIVPEMAKKEFKQNEYIAVAVPTWGAKYIIDGFTQHVVEVGDHILTTKNAEMLIEDKYHPTLPEPYVAFQSRMVCAVLHEA